MRSIATLQGMLSDPFLHSNQTLPHSCAFQRLVARCRALYYTWRGKYPTSREILHRRLRAWAAQLVAHSAHPDASRCCATPRCPISYLQQKQHDRWRPCCFAGNTMSVRYGVRRRFPLENRSEMSALDLIVSNRDALYTQRRLRPLARRAARTLRPPLVAMRARKPWHLARLRVLG